MIPTREAFLALKDVERLHGLGVGVQKGTAGTHLKNEEHHELLNQ